MDSTTDRLANLSPAKRALLERLSAARSSSDAQRNAPIAPRTPSDPVVLTAVQRRLWLLSQLDPEAGTAYNVPRVLRLTGGLDVDALRAALSAVVARHEVLRTRIVLDRGEPCAVIDPARVVDLPSIDAPDDAEALRLAAAEAVRPFDLAADLLLRALLIRLAGGDHLLVVTTHHVASDEGSRVVLLRDLAAAYAATAGMQAPAIEPAALQYGDYAAWQLARESNGQLEPHVRHCAEQLAGAPDDIDLPTDHPRPAVRRIDGKRLSFDLGPQLSARIESLARSASTTTFTVLLASFAVLLQRLSGQDDLVIGVPVTGRHRPELADVVGCFANTLALRLGIDRDATFRETVAQVHAVNSDGLAHQDAPFDLVVERLAPRRDPGRNALFQVCYNHVSGSTAVTGFPGITAEIVDLDPGVAKFDFTLVSRESPGGLRLLWEFRADLFEPETVERWHRHFVVLLDSALADPDAAVGSLQLLEPAELEVLRASLDATSTPIDVLTLPALVRRSARRAPDAVAVADESEQLTYAGLDAASDALAGRLRGLGIGRGDFVAVCVERSARMVAALLGVHKAGAAYLPLDPSFPTDRLAFMLTDSGARVAITETPLRGIVDGEGRTVLLLDDPATLSPAASDRETAKDGADDEVAFTDLAYAIYTSGSTGVPKGVLIEHGALSNFLQSMAVRPGCAAGDVLVAVTTLSFDIAALELFLPLVTGATVVVASRDTASDPRLLAALLDSRAATILQATPSTWRMLLDSGWTGRPGLRMLCGGEALPPTLAAGLHACGAALWNMYGPTETTIWSSVDQVRPGSGITLGEPIANTDFLVVDQRLQPVPVGVAGELLIGGLGLARGYHNRPELTAEKFVAHPLIEGARAYRTGDLVRAQSDGGIEFLGRLDHQVKVRGFRIELGEVERALASHPAVRDAVAVVREDRPGDRRLIGYVVTDTTEPGPAGPADGNTLRQHVGERLPGYMVPSIVVVLDSMPRTPNGKTDRKRLPVPAEVADAADTYVAPRTPLEQGVAALWADVLGISRVGLRDNFFGLGGDSLRAVRLVSRLNDEFATSMAAQLSIRSFVDSPTVEGVVALISETSGGLGRGTSQLPGPVHQQAVEYPLSFTQQRMWFIDRLEPGSPLYTVAAGYLVDGPLDLATLQRALDAVVARHEVLRSVLVEVDGEPVQQVRLAASVPLDVTDTDDEERAHQLVNAAAAVPFDLATGPLVRAVVVRLGSDRHVLTLLLHHAVIDGWAIDVLVDELIAHYAAGGIATLDEPPLQFGDYARWQRETLDGEVLEQQLDYWRTALTGAPDVLALPTDRPRPSQQSYRGARFTTEFDAELIAKVAEWAKSHDSTLFQALLAGFAGLIARYSGQDDIVVGTSISGRERSELQGLIGYLANTIALRIDTSDDPSPRVLLGRARDTVQGASAHADMPFDRLVDSLDLPRDLSRNPLFQVMLLMQPPRPAARTLGDASLQAISLDRGTARFDLTVSCTQTPNGLSLGVEYSTDLFDEVSVRELVTRFGRLLRAAVAEPETPLSRLPMLTGDELQAALNAATGPVVDVEAATLPQLVARRAAERPDAPAVTGGGRSYSYAELDGAASSLAHALVAAGVERGELVAVGMPRSADLLVAILGIQRAGAAYLPLEPTYPADRLEFMLNDGGVRVLVTASDISLPAAPVKRLLLDDPETLAPFPATDPGVGGQPDDLAYVIYTSGSTGKPKGVLIRHRGVVNLMAEMAERPGLAPGETMVGVTTPAFDLSVPDLFLPLTTGAHLVLAEPEVAADPAALAALLDRVDADVMQATPSTWRMLLDSGWAGRPKMRVVCGGEGYTAALAGPLAEKVAQVWNFYGPTEATVWCTSAHLAQPADPLPLGRALPNYAVYVADTAGRPVPTGVAGEVVIGGLGLARGYHNRPDLTAERFIDVDGRRIYRTGDLGRSRRDGSLQFLGRIDHQVKLRGFRIELGEIEQLLTTHPAVREAVVVLREDSPGDQRLVAYAVLDSAAGATEPSELRKHVAAALPAYMVPSTVVALDSMPRTPNGKTDRNRLPVPQAEVVASDHFVAPRSPIEEAVAEMWCEVLRLDRVGVHDDFFSLGGHSLRITQVMSRIRTAFGIDLPLRQVYEAPTVEAMAEAVTLALLGDESLADFMDEVGDLDA